MAILRYPELAAARRIEDVLDARGRAVILFLTRDRNTGHWQTLWANRDSSISFFVSYGLAPDATFDWLSDQEEAALGQTRQHLSRLLKDAVRRGTPVFYNTVQYQSKRGDVATCGRWVAWRLLHKDASAADFARQVARWPDPDAGVTAATERLLARP